MKTVINDKDKVLFSITDEVLRDFYGGVLPDGQIAIPEVPTESAPEGQELFFDRTTRTFYAK
jgi:hypothetical protein